MWLSMARQERRRMARSGWRKAPLGGHSRRTGRSAISLS
ncbi:hypothetical protein BSU04_32925 [Caballeronia sordidicola]|uniref:Uncharacterized protein n=1 Tax=Caballeronia sordidicola TaxID=196367 RepID=A0A226WTY2_CABSO|nr:hypothetical protein BSU04_32925 [Caballeronia sordidicola]